MTPARPLSAPPPVADGVELDLPGDGVRLRATRWPGPGPAVLLLHGLASTRHVWDLVVPHLAVPGGPAVVALDQRGHGDSGRPEGPYDGATVARDALTALDALALSRVVVAGHSWGATTALRLAADAPGRVLACVAVDGGLGTSGFSSRSREQLRELLTPPRLALDPAQLREGRGPLAPWWSERVADAVGTIFEVHDDGLARARLPFDAHMAILDDLLDTDHEDLWRRTTAPLWFLTADPARPPLGDEHAAAKERALERLAEVAPDARVLRAGGAVHDVPLQWPALVAGVVRAAVDDAARVTAAAGEGRSA